MKSMISVFAFSAALCSLGVVDASEQISHMSLMRKKEGTGGDSSSKDIKSHMMSDGAPTEPTLKDGKHYLTEALEDQTNVVKTAKHTNIYFTGKKRKDEVVGNTEKLLRPDLVKFIRCSGSVCSDCPSQSECGWEGEGSSGAGGRFELKYPKNADKASCSDFNTHVAEYWVDCADGQGKWTIAKNVNGKGKNDDMKVYLVEDGGVLQAADQTEVPEGSGGWTIHASDGPTRIRVVIKPIDCNLQVKAFVKVRGFHVKESAAMCMDTKMCLKELDQDNDADSKLRNSNHEQLRCITQALTSDSCQRWRNCLAQNQVEEDMLLAILQAALPQAGNLAELEPASMTRSTDDGTGSCVHPANDDPLSWECECGQDLHDECGTDSDCINGHMCKSAKVCDSWKNNEGACYPAYIEANESDRPKHGTALDESLTDKRAC